MPYAQIADKAAKYIKHYNTLSGSNDAPKKVKKPPSKDNDKPTPPPPTAESDKANHKKLVVQHTNLLKNVHDPEAYLSKLKIKSETKFNSKAFKNACTNLNMYHVWRKVNGDLDKTSNDNVAAARRACSNP